MTNRASRPLALGTRPCVCLEERMTCVGCVHTETVSYLVIAV